MSAPATALQEYNCGFMIDASGRIALLRKQRPEWQAGFLNGIGGKQEPGETQIDGMRREWAEETGNQHAEWEKVCTIRGEKSRVHFFVAEVDELPELPSENDAGESIEVHNVGYVPNMPDVVPNLRWLVPAAMSRDFKIESPN